MTISFRDDRVLVMKHGKCCQSYCDHTNSNSDFCMRCGVTDAQLDWCRADLQLAGVISWYDNESMDSIAEDLESPISDD